MSDDDQTFAALRARKAIHPDWVRVQGAKDKFSKLAQEFYEQRYPGCEVTFGVPNRENIRFHCNKALDVYFRVQARGASWPEDTLVIANVYNVYGIESKGPLLELFDFIIMAQEEVGYFNLGFEFPGKHEVPLIKQFGFKRLEHLAGGWTISIVALKEVIDAGSTCS
ncbi:hypothetical protein P8H27_02030 [Pseudomonas sp. sp1636]|uniref:hypothetical protein n=1 Tax=Pseudomonas sp. sp1636 TaxID=3036707 RepID=UPI0025A6350E|nr:hypothetical protein [Pseudomonas sp. sp1636]MDM8347677.1 hypothetical protein [Pseudomonas sp. sp1636]